MKPLRRPPAAYHAATLSSLTEEPVLDSTQSSGAFVQQRSHESSRATTPIYDNYTRHGSVTFTDISNFSSPRESRLNCTRQTQDHSRDSSRRPPSEINSSASSVYDLDKKIPERPEPPYHVFSTSRQNAMLYLASIAGIFSSLSSNIYFPALGIIANVRADTLEGMIITDSYEDVHVSLSTISFTVTVYMIIQGLSPSFWGPLSDTKGRRITYLGPCYSCLAQETY